MALCFLWQYHIVQVCINGEGQQYTAGYLSVSSDNIIVYRYLLMEKDNNMLLDILVFLLTISYCTGMHFMYYIVILYYHLVRTMFIRCIFIYMHFCRMMKVSFHQHDGRNNWSKPAWSSISFFLFWCGFIMHFFWLFV
jgi:hypothetical protein